MEANRLYAELQAVDNEMASTQEPIPEPGKSVQVRENAEEKINTQAGHVRKALEMALMILGPMFPTLKKVYTPKVIESVSVTSGALAVKYGWDLDLIKFEEEIAFAFVMYPVAMGTYQAVLHDLNAKKVIQGETVEASAGDESGDDHAGDQ